MGIRETQYYGLPAAAMAWLLETAAELDADPCPHCRKPTRKVQDCWVHGGTQGMEGEPVPFHAYRLKNGRIVREVLQETRWSSGPMIFTKLVDGPGKDLFAWAEAELLSYP